jgi:hypothetical protein
MAKPQVQVKGRENQKFEDEEGEAEGRKAKER